MSAKQLIGNKPQAAQINIVSAALEVIEAAAKEVCHQASLAKLLRHLEIEADELARLLGLSDLSDPKELRPRLRQFVFGI